MTKEKTAVKQKKSSNNESPRLQTTISAKNKVAIASKRLGKYARSMKDGIKVKDVNVDLYIGPAIKKNTA